MSQVIAFGTSMIDGSHEIDVCDGTHHYHLTEYDEYEHSPVISSPMECDGSCRSQELSAKLRDQIQELRDQEFLDGTRVYRNRVSVSRQVKNMITTESLHGRLVHHWYMKRSSRGEVYALDNGMFVMMDMTLSVGEVSRVCVEVLPDDHVYASTGIHPDTATKIPALFAAAMEWQQRMNAEA